jgi:type II secretory pathway pseudopilin PulG
MKKYTAFTLMEMLIVMTIMVIILGLGMSAYITFTESTKFNEDVANIQSDILTMQRAAMLFKKDKDDGWAYGLGIDFDGVLNGDGTYRFFKWCSGFKNYGSEQTSGPYPNYNDTSGQSDGINMTINYDLSSCVATSPEGTDSIVSLSGYGLGRFNLKDDVIIREISNCGTGASCYPRFLLFEAVTGRVFVFDSNGIIIPPDQSGVEKMKICLDKNFGESHELTIDYLTGKTNLSIVDNCEP